MNELFMNTYTSRLLVIGGSVIVVLLLLTGLLLWMSSPLRPVRGFLSEVEQQQKDKALAYVVDNADASAKDDIQFFLDDWMAAGKPKIEIEKTDAYNTTVDGDKTTLKPTPKYWAHNARVFVTVSFEEFDDPVMFTITRKSGGNGLFSNIFRGWKIATIEYQPIGEEVTADDATIETDDATVQVDDSADTNTADDANTTNTDAASDGTTVNVSGDQEDPGLIEQ